MFIIILYYILFSIILIYGLYFSLTGVIGLIKKNNIKIKETDNKNHFAILIPARNEEKIIVNLLESLKLQDYPKNKFDIYVIPNNCIDNTKEISLENKAKIIDCDIKPKTKGDVLKYAFKKLKSNKRIDAYIIFDADNVVDSKFLYYMNIYLENGYNVAQGFRDAKNPSDNWLSGSYAIYYLFQNVFFNHARMNLKGSASINGTGFMVKKSYIDDVGFDTNTLTEDMEFTGLCSLRNEKIAFVEEAITYDEYPSKFGASWKQRKRWSAGIMECSKMYSFKLLKNFFKNKNISSLDISLVYLGPLIQILSFINLVMLVIFRLSGIYLNDFFSYLFAYGILFFIITYIMGILIELFIIYYKKKNPHKLLSGIIFFPIFIFTWIPINIVCLIKKQTKWDTINHDRNVKISEVNK